MSQIRIMVPAAVDLKGDGGSGWAILSGATYPPEVVAFCWEEEHAKKVFDRLGGQAAGYYYVPATIEERG